MYQPTTTDQKFYTVNGQQKAEIDVCLGEENKGDPSIRECRHAVLPIDNGYVIYDRLLNRIVNGTFYRYREGEVNPYGEAGDELEHLLELAQDYNINPRAPQDMAPNGRALGLKYPVK